MYDQNSEPVAHPLEGGIILKPTTSGRMLVEQIIAADQIDFGISFEPWPEQTAVVIPLLRRLEELHPHTFSSPFEYDWNIQNSVASRLEASNTINTELMRLPELKPEGLHILFGLYSVLGLKWRIDSEEGRWYTGTGQQNEVLQVAALRIAPISIRQHWISVKGGKPLEVTANGQYDGEIPF
jgi:hypothetical protein